MIKGAHTFIRTSEHDDVPALASLYRSGSLRAGLLDMRREPVMPNLDELRDLLGRKEIAEGDFYTVEDCEGQILGFCSLRGMNPEARFCEFSLLLRDPEGYATPAAAEAADFLLERAFTRWGLRKVLAYCLPHEAELAEFLRRRGFSTAGVQRDVLYSGGRWQSIETFTRARSPLAPA